MANLKIFYSRLRAEEKLLFKAAEKREIPFEAVDVREIFWPEFPVNSGDVVMTRIVSQLQNLSLAQLLESRGIRTVNPSRVISLCGDKIATAAVLDSSKIPQPEYRVAFSPDEAIAAAEDLGYPVVFKPAVGSWGRLLAKLNDREAVEALVEHKSHMGSQHSVFFIQKYVEKGGWDLRAAIVGGRPVAAIQRWSDHWITNTARGGRAEGFEIKGDLERILEQVQECMGGDFLAVDLFLTDQGWLVNEVNPSPEFRNSINTTGVDIPDLMVMHAWSQVQDDFPKEG